MADLNLTNEQRARLLAGETLSDEELDKIAEMSGGAAAPTGAGVPVGLTPSGEIDLLQVAKQLRSQQPESEEMQSQAPEAGVWDYLKAGASGAYTGAKESVGSIFSMLGALPGQIADLPENISAISRYGELTPKQQEAVKQGMVQAGKQMIPGYNYMQQVTTPEERANLEQLAKYSLFEGMAPGLASVLGVQPPPEETSLRTLLPESPQEMEELGQLTGETLAGPLTAQGAKLTLRGAGKVAERLPYKEARKQMRATELARMQYGGIAEPLRLMKSNTQEEAQVFKSAQRNAPLFKKEAADILGDIPTDAPNRAEIAQKILGYVDENGEEVPGAFEKYKAAQQKIKADITDKVDQANPGGLLVADIDTKELDDKIEQLKKNSLKTESREALEEGLETFKRDFISRQKSDSPDVRMLRDEEGNLRPLSESGLTVRRATEYIAELDDELRKLGLYDNKTWKAFMTNPSTATKVINRVDAIQQIRKILAKSQRKAIEAATDINVADAFDDANKKISMAIDYENLFERAINATLQGLTDPNPNSLLSRVAEGGSSQWLKKIEQLVSADPDKVEKVLQAQADIVDDMMRVSRISRGELPRVTELPIPGLLTKPALLTPSEAKATAAGSLLAPSFERAMETPAVIPTGPTAQESPAAQSLLSPQGPLATMPETTTTTMPPTTTTMGGAPELTMPTEEEGFEAPEAPMGAAAAAAAMPQMPEGPMQLPVDTGLFTAPPKPFTPIKPSTDTILDSFNDLAPQLQQVLPPEESMNVLDTLNQAIQSKSDDALGRTVTALLKQYPEARTLFVDEFPDMPIFTFNKKIYQEDDKRAFEKIINDSKASSIAKSKSLSALNRDGSVIMPR
jgi:hypothetical protein